MSLFPVFEADFVFAVAVVHPRCRTEKKQLVEKLVATESEAQRMADSFTQQVRFHICMFASMVHCLLKSLALCVLLDFASFDEVFLIRLFDCVV